jgi:hypothetical protein
MRGLVNLIEITVNIPLITAANGDVGQKNIVNSARTPKRQS